MFGASGPCRLEEWRAEEGFWERSLASRIAICRQEEGQEQIQGTWGEYGTVAWKHTEVGILGQIGTYRSKHDTTSCDLMAVVSNSRGPPQHVW